ncbi:hypothetical protein JFL43_20320 [Viridibacillus sp. YIM B01967]|uniref:DUF3139 domain-containing protein n=1 Tax=Viridibacillus soli TaxID=2798301 RepID=A0ABS1HCK2_9BACL|nr:hypothetical protein [Viridibacillus soli]MBK3497134.1 hypothetical protein [Viridibacillus soli]
MKKAGIFIIVLSIIAIGVFGVFKFKMNTVESAVLNYLITEENIPEDMILNALGFIANLPNERNWMVSVKLKEDDKTYYYYKNKNDEVILESYVENGYEYVYPNGILQEK